jgi:hypothetical protein
VDDGAAADEVGGQAAPVRWTGDDRSTLGSRRWTSGSPRDSGRASRGVPADPWASGMPASRRLVLLVAGCAVGVESGQFTSSGRRAFGPSGPAVAMRWRPLVSLTWMRARQNANDLDREERPIGK